MPEYMFRRSRALLSLAVGVAPDLCDKADLCIGGCEHI